MNMNEVKRINERLFEQAAKWECEWCVSEQGGERVICGRPATHVVQWRHHDGDRERRIFCQEHALEQQKYWTAMDWDTGIDISNIEDWDLCIRYGGRTATRVGRNFPMRRHSTRKAIL